MSLDLYAGSLGRYYQRDFETPQQRYGRENNLETSIVYSGDTPNWLTPNNTEKSIDVFKDELFRSMGETCRDIRQWDESSREYKTEQLFAECHAALLLVTAYTYRSDLTRPKKLIGDVQSDVAIDEASERKYYMGPLAIFECHLFLPSKENGIAILNDPMGWQIAVTTTSALRDALEYVAEYVWGNAVFPQKWFEGGAVPVGRTKVIKKSKFPWKRKSVWMDDQHSIDDEVLWNAQYAYAVFLDFLKFAEANNVPIRQDG